MEITEKSTLYDLLLKNLQEIPQAKAYRQYDGRQWVDWTWDQVGREVARWQAAFASGPCGLLARNSHRYKKSGRDIFRDIPNRSADVSPPANCLLALQGPANPFAFADPSANEKWPSFACFVPR